MGTAHTPVELLDAARALDAEIRAAADETERGRTLAPRIVQRLTDARLFDLVLPEAYGGIETDAVTLMRVIEQISTSDGSSGWCVGIGNATDIVAGSLAEEAVRALFGPGRIAGGTLAPIGRAVVTDGGYRVSGRWPFASGSPHCSTLTAGALVHDDDGVRTRHGAPDWRLVVMPSEKVRLHDTWHVAGLRGTGSGDMELDDVFVPEAHTMSVLATRPHIDRPLYRFPMIAFLTLSIAPVGLGIARRALDELYALAQSKRSAAGRETLKDRAMAQYQAAEAEATLRAGRAFLYEAAQEAWGVVAGGGRLTPQQRATVRLASAHATSCAVRAVDIAYTLAGGTSLYETSVLQRQFRDVHAATQHALLAGGVYELAGQVLLGATQQPLML